MYRAAPYAQRSQEGLAKFGPHSGNNNATPLVVAVIRFRPESRHCYLSPSPPHPPIRKPST
ncbi:expressed unknown protein [Ectocarpus siliculosus]|uniref:Uncharacterized protein n=1 Tax=Ectocarpus siliculosus TaxID=2880 RepID=D7G1G6_ECTSI|nr:expressed unknown protein [Ectocarpus siliculosus]|eukprot:CBJ26774.1 expressed unknown protein [Ectocarpus siliculosus]